MAFFSKEVKPLRFCVLLGASLGGIVLGVVVWGYVTAPKWQSLRRGMSRDEVTAIMGDPINEQEKGTGVHLLYPYDRMYQMTLTFQDGKLEDVDGGRKEEQDLLNRISN